MKQAAVIEFNGVVTLTEKGAERVLEAIVPKIKEVRE